MQLPKPQPIHKHPARPRSSQTDIRLTLVVWLTGRCRTDPQSLHRHASIAQEYCGHFHLLCTACGVKMEAPVFRRTGGTTTSCCYGNTLKFSITRFFISDRRIVISIL